MRFSLAPEVLGRYPDVCVGVVVAQGVRNVGKDERLRALLAEAAEGARARLAGRDAGEVPELAVWRRRFAELGIDPVGFPSSVEGLARRAVAGQMPTISPAVDVANVVSLRHLVPVGAHDADRLVGEMAVRVATEGDRFTPIGAGAAEPVPAGELVYADAAEVRTRRWVWRLGERAKVTPDTRTVFFPIDGFVGLNDAAVRAAADELAVLAREYLSAETTVGFVAAANPCLEVPIARRELDAIDRALTRGVVEILPNRADLERRLRAGERLTVYMGVDATSPVIHIGHAIQIRKLRHLQDVGCRIILLVGDFTGRIGDPTDKSATRVQLTEEQVRENAATYKEQVAKILDFDSPTNPVEMRYNSAWLGKMSTKDLIEVASVFTVQQMLQRDMFQKRMAEDKPIGLHEFLYPLLQGYDSVAMDVDVEVGGTDQTFNMLAGRTLQKALHNKEKFVITGPLLEGTDGRKMSKSYGNVIGVSDPPADMYGKVMSMADELVPRYVELLTDASDEEVARVRAEIAGGAVNPMLHKKRLARAIVTRFHDAEAARHAEERFEREVQRHELPEEMPTARLERGGPWAVVDLLVATNLAQSRSEARRLIEGGSVQVDRERVGDTRAVVEVRDGTILRARKRSFTRLAVPT